MNEYQHFLWLAIAVVLFLIEAFTLNLVTIWFAVAAFVAMLVSLFFPYYTVTLTVFILCATILLLCTRNLADKFIKKTKTNVDSLQGKTGIVIKQIDNQSGEGQINISGIIWSARSVDDSVIDVEKKVEVLYVSGVRAIVKETN